ncbi:MAG: hypothetical protein ACOX47_03640 [Bacillota bacterium]|jgi:hypothetical protein
MSACVEKIYANILDSERNKFYLVVETYKGELQHKSVLLASQRMDIIILDWYRRRKLKSQ